MNSELVTVVIPCYNQARFLGEAIESVARQSHLHREVIIIDDGSTDDTALVAARYADVQLLRQANRGLAAARNRGLSAARGAYVVFLDADDRLLPRALECGLRRLAAQPDAAFAYGLYLSISADGTPISYSHRPCVEKEHYLYLLQANYIGMHAAVTYKREALDAVGGFNERLAACEDYDLYLRITRRFPICCYPEVVAEYRQHDANMTRNQSLMLKSALDVLYTQRQYIQGNKRYEESFKIGVQFWQNFYGDLVLEEVMTRLHNRADWAQSLRGLLMLAIYYPQGLLKRVWSKAKRSLVNLKPPLAGVK